MAGTRRSARLASSQGSQASSSPPASQPSPQQAVGAKRKSESGASPSAKRGKKQEGEKKQATIEETIDPDSIEQKRHNDDSKPTEPIHSQATKQNEQAQEEKPQNDVARQERELPERSAESKPTEEDPASEKAQPSKPKEEKNEEHSHPEKNGIATNGDAVIPDARKEDTPSSILEKGIMYLVYRGRVGIDEPSNVNDIARTFLVLRPLPHGAKIGDGPMGDEKNCRVIAIPKKVLPLSGKDRWTAFVEKANVSLKELKDTFFGASDYETQTAGTRHVPAAVPVAEGVYAITTTGRESHLAYIITLPQSLGEVQNDLGLREKGSFITSVKNPKHPGPTYADIGKDPGYSQEILDEFRSLRWGPLQPKHLNYENCQFLLVGESSGIEKALSPQKEDERENRDAPKEEMEKLESEDEIRVKHLQGDDAVFADLTTDSKSYPGLQTTW